MKASKRLRPASSPVTASTTTTSAAGPLLTKDFSPSSNHWPSCWRAAQRSSLGWAPACGSEMARATILRPRAIIRSRARWPSLPTCGPMTKRPSISFISQPRASPRWAVSRAMMPASAATAGQSARGSPPSGSKPTPSMACAPRCCHQARGKASPRDTAGALRSASCIAAHRRAVAPSSMSGWFISGTPIAALPGRASLLLHRRRWR